MRVGYYQYEPEFGAVAKNLEVIRAKLEQTEADLMVLPELCASGYQFVSAEEAQQLPEPVPDGPTTTMLVEVAKRCQMHIVAGLPERAGTPRATQAVVAGPSELPRGWRESAGFFEGHR